MKPVLILKCILIVNERYRLSLLCMSAHFDPLESSLDFHFALCCSFHFRVLLYDLLSDISIFLADKSEGFVVIRVTLFSKKSKVQFRFFPGSNYYSLILKLLLPLRRLYTSTTCLSRVLFVHLSWRAKEQFLLTH